MRHYPSYRLDDFYGKSFLNGGVTYKQALFLFRSADEEIYENLKFQAGIHGIDLEADVDENSGAKKIEANSPDAAYMFKDPKVYEAMSQEEREKETAKMMGHWRGFSIRSSPKG